MHIASSSTVLTVADVAASSRFLVQHFGFTEQMTAPGFAALARGDIRLAFMQRGSEVLPPALRERCADGVTVALSVRDLAAQEARLRAAAVPIVLPLTEQPWGERLFMVKDPNGVIYELLEWRDAAPPPELVAHDHIVVRGAHVNNLKGVSLDLPKRKLTVFTGVSGSGKSSLVFDTLAAESQRLINETFSTFVQTFLPRFARPDVETLRNLSMAIVVGQERIGGNSRSTVGTATDAYALLRLLFSRLGEPRVASASALSFNDPTGMCLTCEGLGRRSSVDSAALVDRDLSLGEGAIGFPNFQVGGWFWSAYAKSGLFDPEKKLRDYTDDEWQLLLHGGERKVKIGTINSSYEGLVPKLKRLYLGKDIDALQPHLRSAVERVVTFAPCDECAGTRLNAAARSCRVDGKSIAECAAMQVSDLASFVRALEQPGTAPVVRALGDNLDDLVHIGLGYLSLSRESSTLSGGESQRIKMVRHLGSSLTDMTYIFDEPSVGLHAHDLQRVCSILCRLRDKGNTVLVVEHKPAIIMLADHVVDMGPGAGVDGGRVTYQGDVAGLLASGTSTGEHLGRRRRLKTAVRAPRGELHVRDATLHNLQNVSVCIPKGVLTVITGVAGSGKSALIRGCLPQQHRDVVVVDQRITRGSRRSNLATYSGLLDPIRKVFAKANKVDASLFSANSKGACPECKGLGVVYTDLAFMAGVSTPCETCEGRRFTPEVLQHQLRGKNIHEVLTLSVRDAHAFFSERAVRAMLGALVEVGLGYIALGQPLDTLSGGERQRLELGIDLGAAREGTEVYVLDEPTTGLHLRDVDHLLGLLDRFVESGRSVIVIEHNLDVVAHADWVIDMGPGAGRDGGRVVFEGTPRQLIAEPSLTGKHLAMHLAAPGR